VLLLATPKTQGATPENIKKLKKTIMAIPERDYLACFEEWKKSWHKDYLKGNEVDLEK